MSGGEQQRIAIARALIAETDIILAMNPVFNSNFTKYIFIFFKTNKNE